MEKSEHGRWVLLACSGGAIFVTRARNEKQRLRTPGMIEEPLRHLRGDEGVCGAMNKEHRHLDGRDLRQRIHLLCHQQLQRKNSAQAITLAHLEQRCEGALNNERTGIGMSLGDFDRYCSAK